MGFLDKFIKETPTATVLPEEEAELKSSKMKELADLASQKRQQEAELRAIERETAKFQHQLKLEKAKQQLMELKGELDPPEEEPSQIEQMLPMLLMQMMNNQQQPMQQQPQQAQPQEPQVNPFEVRNIDDGTLKTYVNRIPKAYQGMIASLAPGDILRLKEMLETKT